MSATINVTIPTEMPAPTLRQIKRFVWQNRINIELSDFDSIQKSFSHVVFAVRHMTEIEIYNQIIQIKGD